jgi:hypothetical protein
MIDCAVRDFGPEACATLAMRGPYDQMPHAFATIYGWLAVAGHTPVHPRRDRTCVVFSAPWSGRRSPGRLPARRGAR